MAVILEFLCVWALDTDFLLTLSNLFILFIFSNFPKLFLDQLIFSFEGRICSLYNVLAPMHNFDLL